MLAALVRAAAENGTSFGAPTEAEVELALHLRRDGAGDAFGLVCGDGRRAGAAIPGQPKRNRSGISGHRTRSGAEGGQPVGIFTNDCRFYAGAMSAAGAQKV